MTEHEPEIVLRDGTRVNQAIFEWCQGLLDRGHTIEVVDGDVFVQPRCSPDMLSCLAAAWRDVEACVDELTAPVTVH